MIPRHSSYLQMPAETFAGEMETMLYTSRIPGELYFKCFAMAKLLQLVFLGTVVPYYTNLWTLLILWTPHRLARSDVLLKT
ncbi:hypothetical protein BDV59DRAFT_180859 [Aspergillus ambiguus]|uniref:uncharacterized protein n=1 Tax=Aspergillus ambiguus TaxID=176160 RepID=UPI003CCD8382